jgi:hypothetical protein
VPQGTVSGRFKSRRTLRSTGIVMVCAKIMVAAYPVLRKKTSGMAVPKGIGGGN